MSVTSMIVEYLHGLTITTSNDAVVEKTESSESLACNETGNDAVSSATSSVSIVKTLAASLRKLMVVKSGLSM